MEIIVLSGGLGNQMFQYAFYLKKRELNEKVMINDYSVIRESTHNGYELSHVFNIQYKQKRIISLIVMIIRKLLIFEKKKKLKTVSMIGLFLSKFVGIKVINEDEVGRFDIKYIQKRKGFNLYFGFWQSEKYFLSIKDIIYNVFTFSSNISDKTKAILDNIQSTESVSIHIRRGDYLSKKYNSIYGNICTLSYYEHAILRISDSVSNPVFFIFSDDIAWVKENIDIPYSTHIDWNLKEDSWQDMFLISKCKHNIIANSTFSWWGAWLNKNPNKIVITPQKFMNNFDTPDLIPSNWITL
jgi:hypothetical protein